MARHLAVCIAALALALATARVAEAKCAGPSPAVAPVNGSATSGVSWVFVPAHRSVEISAQSAHDIETRIEKISETEIFATYRVEVSFSPESRDLPDRTRYTVRVDGPHGGGLATEYVMASEPAEAPAGRVLLEDARYEIDRWTCSHTDAVIARPSIEAPAYRIEWARSEAAYRAGEREVLVVPQSMRSFWSTRAGHGPATLELGHLSCFGATIPEAALAETVYLGIVPLGRWATPGMPADPIAVRSGDPPHIEVLAEPEPEPEPQLRCGLAARYDEMVAASEPASFPLSLLLALLGVLAGLPLGLAASRRLPAAALARLDAWSLPQLTLVAGSIAIAGAAPIAAAGGLMAGVSASLAGALLGRRRRQASGQ